jgi:hypothetical protein
MPVAYFAPYFAEILSKVKKLSRLIQDLALCRNFRNSFGWALRIEQRYTYSFKLTHESESSSLIYSKCPSKTIPEVPTLYKRYTYSFKLTHESESSSLIYYKCPSKTIPEVPTLYKRYTYSFKLTHESESSSLIYSKCPSKTIPEVPTLYKAIVQACQLRTNFIQRRELAAQVIYNSCNDHIKIYIEDVDPKFMWDRLTECLDNANTDIGRVAIYRSFNALIPTPGTPIGDYFSKLLEIRNQLTGIP